ncbi:MAG TPA: SDR family oxidoreductase [Solirubrobacteraceae bacterium]|nr:SDR family oxidoreductase [Solirubrobacteraceae bacterium]
MSLFDLSDRTALLTGATGRLGRTFAEALANAGANVVLTARGAEELARVETQIGPRILGTVTADLTDEREIDRLFDEVHGRWSGLDILVNNAGAGRDAPFGSVRASDMAALQALNVTSPYLCSQRAAQLMTAGGKIVNVGSIYGTVAVDTRIYEQAPGMVQASPAYIASKSALVTLTRELAVRLAPDGIQVNMLSPGGVEADQPAPFRAAYAARTPSGRMARAEDLAGTLVYLCSAASDYVTGQNVLVDGGFTAW